MEERTRKLGRLPYLEVRLCTFITSDNNAFKTILQNNYFIIYWSIKYLSFQPGEVFSRSSGGRGPDHNPWGRRQQYEQWGDCEEWVARKCDLNWQHLNSTMMKQIFQIITGGKTFSLQNNGDGSCAASYQGGFVMMGGCCSVHGRVDRWGINNNI